MAHALDAGLLVSLGSAVLYVALGAWVLTLTPRRRPTILLGAFAIAFGAMFVVSDSAVLFHLGGMPDFGEAVLHPIQHVTSIAHALAGLAILGLAATISPPLQDKRLFAIALGIAVGFSIATWVPALVADGWRNLALAGPNFVASVTIWGASLLLALRASPSRVRSVEEARQFAMLAVAFAFVIVFVSGAFVTEAARMLVLQDMAWFSWFSIVVLFWLTVGALWGNNMLQASKKTVGIHRAAMVATFGLLLAGALYEALLQPGGMLFGTEGSAGLGPGLARALGVAILAYGVLRYDIAGLDAKVQWGVSRTTVAASFIAVFFIASELAKVFFEGALDSTVLGILAAGVLLFAIAPLQRAADRLAARTVPSDRDEEGLERAEETYRVMLRRFLADGDVSVKEKKALADLAEELGWAPRACSIWSRRSRRSLASDPSGEGMASRVTSMTRPRRLPREPARRRQGIIESDASWCVSNEARGGQPGQAGLASWLHRLCSLNGGRSTAPINQTLILRM